MSDPASLPVCLIFVATPFIAAGLLTKYWVRERRGAARRASETPRLRVEEIAQLRPPPERVAVEARTLAAATGTVRSRLTGADCVWYTVRVWQVDVVGDNGSDHKTELYRESGGADPIPATDGTGKLALAVELAESALLPSTESLAEAVVDEETRRTRDNIPAVPAPHLAELLRTGTVSEDRMHPTTTTRFQVEELVVRPGQRALIIGRPRIVDDTVLLEPVDGGGVTLLTDDEIAAYDARTRTSVQARLWPPLLILGAGLLVLMCWLGVGPG